LKDFAHNSTLAKREEIADAILTELNLMIVSIRFWAQKKDSKAGFSAFQQDQLKKALEDHYSKMREVNSLTPKSGVLFAQVIGNLFYTEVIKVFEEYHVECSRLHKEAS